MSQEIVNLGSQPNDGTGDSIRDAFTKVNNNFNEVYSNVAVLQTYVGTFTTISSSISQIKSFSSTIANFSATQALFQSDLNNVTGNNKIFKLTVSTSAPTNPVVGTFAVADRVTWDPATKGSGSAYPVFYNGTTWNALY
jgi:hypothetical protein